MMGDFREKYRPKLFSEIVGNRRIIKILTNMLESGDIRRGIVFHGLPGSGKTTLAKLFVKGLHCQHFSGDVCGKCGNCESFDNNTSLGRDYSFHDCTKINKQNLEDLLTSLRNGWPSPRIGLTIHILDEFQRTTENLQEKFLIPLEIHKDILLIFCLIEIKTLTEAFRQRVMVLKTSRPEIDELLPWLQRICTAEAITIKDNNALRQVALTAGQLPRECLSLLEKVFLLGEPLSTTLVRELARDLQEDQGYTLAD